MEQDLSFILLVIAGLVLLILFIYSLKTRVRPGRRTELDHDVLNPMGEDKHDVLSMPLNAQEPYIEVAALNSTVKGDILEEESTVNFEESIDAVNAPKEIIEDTVEPQAVAAQVIVPKLVKAQVVEEDPSVHSKLIVLNVLPQEGRKFIGYELLQALLAANLRHGAMSIFHRYESAMGEGKVLFSVAQVTEPGTFNLDAMGSCQCSGLTMFMQLTGPEHNLKAYEMFIQAAQQIADNLRGVLVDQKLNALMADSTKRFKSQVQAHLLSLSSGKTV